jgi:hypothetical protein
LAFAHNRQDEPPYVQKGGDIEWEEELHKLVKLERILGYPSLAQKESRFTSDLSSVFLRENK